MLEIIFKRLLNFALFLMHADPLFIQQIYVHLNNDISRIVVVKNVFQRFEGNGVKIYICDTLSTVSLIVCKPVPYSEFTKEWQLETFTIR